MVKINYKALLFLCPFVVLLTNAQENSVNNLVNTKDFDVQINSSGGMQIDRDEKVIIAQDEAVVIKDNVTLNANIINARYRENGENKMEIYRIDASGRVKIAQEQSTIMGENGIYDLDQRISVIYGTEQKPVTGMAENGSFAALESAEYYELENKLVLRGNAYIGENQQKIRADILVVWLIADEEKEYFAKLREQKQEVYQGMNIDVESFADIKRIEAHGNVVAENNNENISSDWAVWEQETDMVVFLQNVVMRQDQTILKGCRAELNFLSGKARLSNRSCPEQEDSDEDLDRVGGTIKSN